MEVSEKLARSITTILSFHIVALLLLVGFSFVVFLKAKKTNLFYSYLLVLSMLILWIISKIFKTVSPTLSLRWLFIVSQYIGVYFLGYFLLVFAYIYHKNKTPSKKQLLLWVFIPLFSFVVVLTNPLHMQFYSYFDIYRDKFGPFFYPLQVIQYVYILIAVILLSQNYVCEAGFSENKSWGRFFVALILIPLFSNIYYILFKLDLLEWIFPFAVFDFTPISGSLAIMLFMIPVLKYRIFDYVPISYAYIYDQLPQGITFVDLRKKRSYGGNNVFVQLCQAHQGQVESLITKMMENPISENIAEANHRLLTLKDRIFQIEQRAYGKHRRIICFKEMTKVYNQQQELKKQTDELIRTNEKLDQMIRHERDLATAKAKAKIAQDMHDILGHSLTVIIGTTELAILEGQEISDSELAKERLREVKRLLETSLRDLKTSKLDINFKWTKTSLIKAIQCLKNDRIDMELVVQGEIYELTSEQTEGIFRLCQESITNSIRHGKAKHSHIIIRYEKHQVQVFVIDDGQGCSTIKANYGLSGIEARIKALKGEVSFGSDGEQGFHIHANIPVKQSGE